MDENGYDICPIRRVLHKYFQLIREKELPPIRIVTELKRELLEAAMELSQGNKKKAAEILNMNRTSFIMMHRSFQELFFKRVICNGDYELTIRSKDEIPEWLVKMLTSDLRKYTS